MTKRFKDIEKTKKLFERGGMFINAKFGALTYKYEGASILAATNNLQLNKMSPYDLQAIEVRTYMIELTHSNSSKDRFPFNEV